MSTKLLFMLAMAVLLLSLLMLAEALPSRYRAVCAASSAALGGSCPLLASSKMKDSGPTASNSRACVLASCLSLAFVCADSLDLRTSSIFGQAVTAVRGAPYLAFHCLLSWLSSAVTKQLLRKLSVFCETGNSFVPVVAALPSCSSSGSGKET